MTPLEPPYRADPHIVHDLRNMLSVVMGNVGTMKARPVTKEEADAFADIDEALVRCGQLLNELQRIVDLPTEAKKNGSRR